MISHHVTRNAKRVRLASKHSSLPTCFLFSILIRKYIVESSSPVNDSPKKEECIRENNL